MPQPLTIETVRLIQANPVAGKYACFRHYTQIAPDVAEELVELPLSELDLAGLDELPDSLADALSAYRGELFLNGLSDISVHAIRAFSKSCPKLELDGIRQLSAEQAQALLDFPGELSLRGLEVMGDTAYHRQLLERLLDCDGIAHYKLQDVSLDALRMLVQKLRHLSVNLSSITVEQAHMLAAHSGSLSLNGLHSFEPEIARILVRHDGDLDICDAGDIGFEALPLETWVELSRFEHHLSVQVRSISDEAASRMADAFRGTINLGSLVDVSEEALISLARLNGNLQAISDSDGLGRPTVCCVEVPSLGFAVWKDTPGHLHYMRELCARHTLPRIAAASGLSEDALASWSSDWLPFQLLQTPEFWNVEHMAPGIAEILGQHPGGVIIRRMANLTLDVAKALSSSKLGVGIRSLGRCDLDAAEYLAERHAMVGVISRLDNIPEGQACVRLLRQYLEQQVAVRSYISLDTTTINVGIAEELLRLDPPHPTLSLFEVKELSFPSANILSQWKGELCFGQPQMCPDTIALLGKFQAECLSFGWDELSAEVAASLSLFRGRLWLRVKTLSDEAAEHLARHRNQLDFPNLETLSIVAADYLARHRPKTAQPKAALSRHPELGTSRMFRRK